MSRPKGGRKLNEAQVSFIRQQEARRQAGKDHATYRVMATAFNVSVPAIFYVAKGRNHRAPPPIIAPATVPACAAPNRWPYFDHRTLAELRQERAA